MRPRNRWKRRATDDRGFTIVEVGVAAFILAIGVTTVIGSMGAGMGLVGHSRQRSAGTGIAQERLERARNVAYADLALNEDPTYNPEAAHPDHNVTENGEGPQDDQYRVADSACASPPCHESLVIDLDDGGLKHLDDPFTLAHTEFTVHQFVTWVDDPQSGVAGTQDYKRVTVVVTWKFPVHTGPRQTVTQSTFVTDGAVTLPTPSTTPSPTPTGIAGASGGGDQGTLGVGGILGPLLGTLPPPSSGQGPCADDTTPPQIVASQTQLLSGSGTDSGYLNSTSVQMRLKARDLECSPLTLYMANKPSRSDCTTSSGYAEVQPLDAGTGTAGDPEPATVSWTIPTGDGIKALCAVVQNKSNNESLNKSEVWGVSVNLDQTRPTVPANFREGTCQIQGSDRDATLNWDASSDANFNGYRLYRSYEGGAFTLADQTTSLTLTDTSPKNYASVRYVIRGYDKAGNESVDSLIVSYSKNQC
jgi:type II secretory pathway pseudopilin PulG